MHFNLKLILITFVVVISVRNVHLATLKESKSGFKGAFKPPTSEKTARQESITSTQCGDVLSGTNGTIFYKSGELLERNERCVWTVRTPFTKITFTVLESGIPENKNIGISISTFQPSIDGYIHPLVQEPLFLLGGEGPITVYGVGAIVTLITGDSVEGQGFILHFEGSGPPNSVSPNSSDFILNGTENEWNSGQLSYPTQGGNYRNNELSTFIFSLGGFKKDSCFDLLSTTLTVRGFEECLDYIEIYKFSNGWELFEIWCNGARPFAIEHDDMFLYAFTSNEAVTNIGFNAIWEYKLDLDCLTDNSTNKLNLL